MKRLHALCKTGATESEGTFHNDVFHPTKLFQNLVTDVVPSQPLSVLIGMKGSGKSAVLRHLYRKLPCPRLFIRPSDIRLEDSLVQGGQVALSQSTRVVYEHLIVGIAACIGAIVHEERERGLGQLENKSQRTLRETAIRRGRAEEDWVKILQNVLSMFTGKAPPEGLVHYDLNSAERLLRCVDDYLRTQEGSKGYFCLLIDDPEQLGAGTDRELHLLWALMLAIRKLTEQIETLRVVIGFRTQVWKRLSWDSRGSRDQFDHFKRLGVQISGSREEQKNILNRRMEFAATSIGLPNKGVSQFFQDEYISWNSRSPGTSDRVISDNPVTLWQDLLVTHARCPRDSVVLLGRLAQGADNMSRERICSEDFWSCILEHSNDCISDVANEYAGDFSGMEVIIRGLSDLNSWHPTLDDITVCLINRLKDWGGNAPKLRDEVLTPDLPSAVRLVALLYEVGVLSVKEPDQSQRRGFRHIHFRDMPSLVDIVNLDDISRRNWEIQPAFRPALKGRLYQLDPA